MLTRVRRGVADVATARKRLEVQIYQLEETVVKLREQHAQALDSGDDPAAALVQSRSSTAASTRPRATPTASGGRTAST